MYNRHFFFFSFILQNRTHARVSSLAFSSMMVVEHDYFLGCHPSGYTLVKSFIASPKWRGIDFTAHRAGVDF